jgi:hypothetical protein
MSPISPLSLEHSEKIANFGFGYRLLNRLFGESVMPTLGGYNSILTKENHLNKFQENKVEMNGLEENRIHKLD